MFHRHGNVPFVLRAQEACGPPCGGEARGIGEMKNDTQLKVQAYLDNELSAGEARKVASLISSDADARGLYNELKLVREALCENEAAVPVPESREFYWSKIRREIEAAEKTPA